MLGSIFWGGWGGAGASLPGCMEEKTCMSCFRGACHSSLKCMSSVGAKVLSFLP